MENRFYDDLLVVLILTLITMICLLIPGSNLTTPFIYIPYILLLLFLPGYSLLAAYNPEFAQYGLLKRVILSIVLSLVFSIFIAALLTYTPLKALNEIIVYLMGAFTIILLLVATMKRKNYHYVRFIEPLGEPVPDQGRPRYEELEPSEEIEIYEEIEPSEEIETYEELEPPLLKVERIENHEEEELKGDTREVDSDDPKLDRPAPKNVVTEPVKIDTDEIKPDKYELKQDEQLSKPKPRPKRRPPLKFAYLDLIIVLLLTIICSVFILEPGLNRTIFDGVTINTIVGLLLMLFLPGYALIAAVNPGKNELNGITRLVLSFGISYFLTSVIGLVLPYTSLGNGLDPILQVISGLTLIFIVAAFVMRIHTPEGERFEVGFGRFPRTTIKSPHDESPLITTSSSRGGSPSTTSTTSITGGHRNRNIMVGVVIVILALLVATPAYQLMKSPAEEVKSFTEFYVLGPDGNNVSTYPGNLNPGENGTVTIVLVNHENATTDYRIITTSNQTVINETNVTLEPNEKKEIPYTFTAGRNGTKKMEFFLYKLPNVTDVYLSYSFWITILGLVNETTESGTPTDTGGDTGGSQEPYVPPYQPPYIPPEPEPEPILDNFMN
ncbi:MAG: DUF1616 domain-containing protein [Methanobacterium sp.]